MIVKNSKEFRLEPVKTVQNEDLVNLKIITENIDSKKVFLNKVAFNSKATFKKNKC